MLLLSLMNWISMRWHYNSTMLRLYAMTSCTFLYTRVKKMSMSDYDGYLWNMLSNFYLTYQSYYFFHNFSPISGKLLLRVYINMFTWTSTGRYNVYANLLLPPLGKINTTSTFSNFLINSHLVKNNVRAPYIISYINNILSPYHHISRSIYKR